jgi:hypothetical protein
LNEENSSGTKNKGKGMPKWALVIIGLVVIAAIIAAWAFTRKDSDTSTSSSNTSTTTATVKAPKHADWKSFTSSKYGFTMYYPTDYTLVESAVGSVVLSKGSTEMVDLYVTVASTSEDSVAKNIAAYMDDSRGYMTDASEVDTTAAGIEATMVTGMMGKSAGINPHVGVKGSSIFFVKNGNLFALDSYYNNNTADFQIFRDILDDMRF